MADAPRPSFPDAPRAHLDSVIEQLVAAAELVLKTQGRLRSLLEASRDVASEIELPVVLRRIISAAVELVGARYGAIGVIAADGSLEQFVHVGMPDEIAHKIGHLPEGHGLLGALIDEQQPIRLRRIADDPRSVGFPPHHPPMNSFLGVPVRVRGEVYGNLYLAERRGEPFTDEDEELITVLAATAGAAIDHARLLEESERRRRWSAASAEITTALVSEQAEDALEMISDRVSRLADAELVCIVLPLAANAMVVAIAIGPLADGVSGRTFDPRGTVSGQAHASGQPVSTDLESFGDDDGIALGPTMAVPFTTAESQTGVLTVTRALGRAAFTSADLEMVADFAGHVSVALRFASSRADRERLAILEDRGRIARDLHDHVIQRLFGAGLNLQAVAGSVADAAAQSKIGQQVEALDEAIVDIRTAIFTLTDRSSARVPLLRHRVVDLLGDLGALFDASPELSFIGPVDLMITTDLADDVVAVVREGLSNVARHAQASRTVVSITAWPDRVVVEISDNGRGFPPDQTRSSGISNLEVRARARRGRCALTNCVDGGAVLRWEVPSERNEK